MEPEGHLAGMLDRDQRTAKLPTTRCAQCARCPHQTCANRYRFQCFVLPPAHRSHRPRSRRHLQIQLKELLLVGTYLLIVIPPAICAPAGIAMDEDAPNNKPEHWVLPPIQVTFPGNVTSSTREEAARESAKFIKQQAKKALDKANANLAKYTQDRFNRTPDKMGMFNHKIEWFPALENLSEVDGGEGPVSPEAVADIMVDLYEQFQKYAVGLDRVRHEHSNPSDNPRLAAMFEEMSIDLKAVLTELQVGIATLGATQREDIHRHHLPTELLRLDETKRLFRDWAIYRDYISLLQYTHRNFDRLAGSSSPTRV